jgi:hypothetical protein
VIVGYVLTKLIKENWEAWKVLFTKHPVFSFTIWFGLMALAYFNS